MENFEGKITVGDWELVPRVEGAMVPPGGRGGRWQGWVMVTEVVARAMTRPSSMYVLHTASGHRLNIALGQWRPCGGLGLLAFSGEDYPPIRRLDVGPGG